MTLGNTIAKSFMLFFLYTILFGPLLSFTNADVSHHPAPLPLNHLVAHHAHIEVESLGRSTNPSIHHYHHNDAYNISARADPAVYAQRIEKGRKLYCAMQDSLALTTQKNGGVSQEADIYDPANLWTEGYRTYIDQFGEMDPFFGDSLNDMMTFVQMPIWKEDGPHPPTLVREQNTAVGVSMIDQVSSISERLATQKKTKPSPAMWQNMINCDPGVIIADYNQSPGAAGEDKDGEVTRIWSWSDAAFLYFKRECGAAAFANLKWVVRAGVINPDSNRMVKTALRASGHTVLPPWGDRITLHPTEDPFFAVLGCKNGAGVAFLLNTHKDAVNGMGVKEVLSVTIWTYHYVDQDISNPAGDTNLSGLCLLFQIVDVPTPNDVEDNQR